MTQHRLARTLGVLDRIDDAIQSPIGAPLLLAAAVFGCCLIGIYSRPVGFLATVWPANAIMLGLLLRLPKSAGPMGWIGAAIAYVAADLLTGATAEKALLLNAANMVGVAAGYLIYSHLPSGKTCLEQPASMLSLVAVAAAAAAAAGVVGGIANPILFHGNVISGWTFWFATELVNYITILPVVLAATWPVLRMRQTDRLSARPTRLAALLPICALILSCVAAIVVGGPGALAFPVPALLWCGFVYAVFPTTIIVLAFGLWSAVAISIGSASGLFSPHNEMALASVRLGAALVALTPITIATVMRNQDRLLDRLRYMANHDSLTGVSTRQAFRDEEERALASGKPFALLMIDVDHFKSVNDRFGHAGGDKVLKAFATRLRGDLRPNDHLGRLGGEEFAVLITDCPEPHVIGIAERIRRETAEIPILLDDGRAISVTASIGVVFAVDMADQSIDSLLAVADELLYRAKKNGRNRIEVSVESPGGKAGIRLVSRGG